MREEDGEDLDSLLRRIDRLCADGDWDGLVRLRDRARAAFLETGRQLWPAASHAEYRLALEAPGPYAAAMLVEGTGHFALGPLPEVAASTHTWDDLSPYVTPGPGATLAAHERALRGEDLIDEERLDPLVLDLPAAVQPWEPTYPLATYKADAADFPAPPAPDLLPVRLGNTASELEDDPVAIAALRSVVDTWVTASNGRVRVEAVRGSAEAAVAAVHPAGTVGWSEVEPSQALAAMAWAGASGGAHGRRRGAAMGRFASWWALAALAAVTDRWPLAPDELGSLAGELRWIRWHPDAPALGWSLHLAVEDPVDGLAWAVAATDRV